MVIASWNESAGPRSLPGIDHSDEFRCPPDRLAPAWFYLIKSLGLHDLQKEFRDLQKEEEPTIKRRSLVTHTHEAEFAEFWVEETLLQAKTCVSNLKFRPAKQNEAGGPSSFGAGGTASTTGAAGNILWGGWCCGVRVNCCSTASPIPVWYGLAMWL